MHIGGTRRTFQKRKLLCVFGSPGSGGEIFLVHTCAENFGGRGVPPLLQNKITHLLGDFVLYKGWFSRTPRKGSGNQRFTVLEKARRTSRNRGCLGSSDNVLERRVRVPPHPCYKRSKEKGATHLRALRVELERRSLFR